MLLKGTRQSTGNKVKSTFVPFLMLDPDQLGQTWADERANSEMGARIGRWRAQTTFEIRSDKMKGGQS